MAVPDARPPTPDTPSVFFVAGEVSGDIQASHLAAEIRRRAPEASLLGVGGPQMAGAGVSVLLDSSTWGVIGHLDPLLRLRTYLRRLRQVQELIRTLRPRLLIFVDFPGFNLRLAEQLRGLVPVVYYFPPMVSVRRGDRARKVARLRMRLLATLRREADAYRAAGADVTWIGHPAVDLVKPAADLAALRRHLRIAAAVPVVGLLPGSRAQEIRAHLGPMLAAARLVAAQVPEVCFILPLAAEQFRPLVAPAIAATGLPVKVMDTAYDTMALATVLLTSTGTATLEAMVLGAPMVAVYRLPWLSWFIARRIASVPYAALPNILAGRAIVPELLQHRMTPQAMAAAVCDLLRGPEEREVVRRALRRVAAELGSPGAAGRAAHEVLARLEGAVATPATGG